MKPDARALPGEVGVADLSNIQRTMRLLASSTPESRNKVRILFYGQSITKQDWWHDVVADLRKRFPHADIEAVNPAIGGFASQRLIITTDRDVCDYYPDLMIFQVFGDHYKYEDIIRTVRSKTTAEIAIQSEHLGADMLPDLPDEGWSRFMNGQFLPAIAKAYHCDLIDVRSAWKRWLLANRKANQVLLSDDIHLNEDGCRLMAEIVAGALHHVPAQPAAESAAWIRAYAFGKDVAFVNGKLRFAFSGNRVTALVGKAAAGSVRVLVDGNPPSAIPALYSFTRAINTVDGEPTVDWPWRVCGPIRISSRNLPVVEDWTITILDGTPDSYRFKLAGTVTGPDGEGTTRTTFVSNSGRVVIEADSWWTDTNGNPTPIRPGYQLYFKSVLHGTDRITAQHDTAELSEVVLAQGLPNGAHVLELALEGEAARAVHLLRVFEPPLKPQHPLQRVSDTVDPNESGTDQTLPAYIFQPMVSGRCCARTCA